MQQNPDYFLDEFLLLLDTNRFISVHYTTIFKELERANVSRKKLQKVAIERDDDKRADFRQCMAQYLPEEISFIDETSKDERTHSRRYARSRKGRGAQKNLPFVCRRHVSTEALLTLDGMVAGTTVEGSITSETFMAWLKFTVVCLALQFSSPFLTSSSPQLPKCSAYLGPLSVLIIDNAKIHHSPEILELCDHVGELICFLSFNSILASGVRLEYLPPYSPDLNPIEEAFSKIKHFLQRHQDYFAATVGDGILADMLDVLQIIEPDDAAGYFIHAGYF